MSRTITSGMQTMLSSGYVTLCRIWTITPQSGSPVYRTDLDEDVVFGGNTYYSDSSFRLNSISSTSGNGVNGTNAYVIFSETGMSSLDAILGAYDDAAIKISFVDWANPDINGEIILLVGNLGAITVTNKGHGDIEIMGLLSRFNHNIGEYYQPECRVDLGSARCGLDLNFLKTTGVVEAVSNNWNFTSTLVNRVEDSYYAFGVLTWDTGANAGLSMEVINQSLSGGFDQIILALNMPRNIIPGDTFTIYAGCDKTPSTCTSKFNNILNFRGEPFVPGANLIYERPFNDTP